MNGTQLLDAPAPAQPDDRPRPFLARHLHDISWITATVLTLGVLIGVAVDRHQSHEHPWPDPDAIVVASGLPADGRFFVRQMIPASFAPSADADLLGVVAATSPNVAFLGANIEATDQPASDTLPTLTTVGPGFTPAAARAGTPVSNGPVFLGPGMHGYPNDPPARLREGAHHLIVTAGYQITGGPVGAIRGLYLQLRGHNSGGRSGANTAVIACRQGADCPATAHAQTKELRRLGVLTDPMPDFTETPCGRGDIGCLGD